MRYEDGKYVMGGKIEKGDCNYLGLTKDIIRLEQIDKEMKENADRELVIDEELEAHFASVAEDEATARVQIFTKKGGYIEQLREHNIIDFDAFDGNDDKVLADECKILYLIYYMKQYAFKHTNVLMLLGNPSMENIDNSFRDWITKNGDMIRYIKERLEEEIPSELSHEMLVRLGAISMDWDEWFEHLYQEVDYYDSVAVAKGYSCQLDISYPLEVFNTVPSVIFKEDNFSPIETLYLKVLQNEFLGQRKDVLFLNSIEIKSDYHVPEDMIAEMMASAKRYVDLDEVETYIDKHCDQIARLVFKKDTTTKEERRKIRYHMDKIPIILNFCVRAKPLIDMRDVLTELIIVACFQAILFDNQNEIFDYTYQRYQKDTKHKPKVNKAMKYGEDTVDALKIYWVRKINDHWYADLGRYELHRILGQLENAHDELLIRIFSCNSISRMEALHWSYYKRLKDIPNQIRRRRMALEML